MGTLLELERARGEGAPRVVAFVHSSSGSASGFRRLVKVLATRARYVAFEVSEPGDAEGCSISRIAADYWRHLEPVLEEEGHPELALVGWSFGGLVAAELAGLAEARGYAVAQVVVLDAAVPEILEPVRSLHRDDQVTEVRLLFGVDLDVTDTAVHRSDEDLAEAVVRRLEADGAGGDLSPDDIVPFIRVHRWHVQALTEPWEPTPFSAPVTLVRAQEETAWRDAPSDLGWSRLLGRDVALLTTPGTHVSLMAEEHASALSGQLDALIGGGRGGDAGPAEADGLPVSSGQSRLWYLWQLEPDGAHYTTQFGWRIPHTTAARVKWAWRHVCARHDVLRSWYRLGRHGEPRRFVGHADDVPVYTLRLGRGDALGADVDAQFAAVANHVYRKPFDLGRSCVRAVIAEDGSGDVRILVSCHHIAVDGWCLDIVEQDLRLLLDEGPDALPAVGADYQDFVAWEHEVRAEPAYAGRLQFWRDELVDMQVVPPPPDIFEDDAEPGAAALRFAFPAEDVARLESAAQANGVTLFTVLLTLVAITLREWAGTPGTAIGVNVANRPRPELNGVVGLFVDPIVLWLEPRPSGRIADALEDVWHRFLAALEHAEVPYQDVVVATGASGRDRWNPLFWAIVNLHDRTLASADGTQTYEPLPPVLQPDVKFPFAVLFERSVEGLSVELLYQRGRYRPSTVDHVRRRLEQLVEAAIDAGLDCMIPPARPKAAAADRFGGLRRSAGVRSLPPSS